MKFPAFFRREKSSAAALARRDQTEKRVAQTLRLLGEMFSKLASAIDQQRLDRAGFREQEKFLTRVERADAAQAARDDDAPGPPATKGSTGRKKG